MLAIINHHYVRKKFDAPFPSIFGITPTHFDQNLKALRSLGKFVSQKNLCELVSQPKLFSDKKSIFITFDDGLQEQFRFALPILKKHNIPGCFYVSTLPITEKKVLAVHKIHLVRSRIGSEIFLNLLKDYFKESINQENLSLALVYGESHYKYDKGVAAQIKYLLNFELDKSEVDRFISFLFEVELKYDEEHECEKLYMNEEQLIELGRLGYLASHSHSHLPLGTLNTESAKHQAAFSKLVLERITNTEIVGFSYPYGSLESCRNMKTILESCNYQYALTTERALNHSLHNPYYLARLDNNDILNGKNYKFSERDFFKYYLNQSIDYES